MTETNVPPPPDTSTGMSRRQALWRSAALAAAGLLVPSIARAQSVPADAVDVPPATLLDDGEEPVGADETLDWTVDPEEAPAAGAEAAYFEAARANEAADLADADEVHAETLEAAAIEFGGALETTKLSQAQEAAESAIETAIVATPADSAEVAGLMEKLQQVRETYRVRQESALKERQRRRLSERDEKQASRQVRRRAEAERKAQLATTHAAMLQELRGVPARHAESRRKQRSLQQQQKRRVAEEAAKARATRGADRTAMNAQQQVLTTSAESLLQQRATRIKREQDYKREKERLQK